MRICEHCGAEFDPREEYCPECGAPADGMEQREESLKICPGCGEYIPLDADVCPACGNVFRKRVNVKLIAIIGGLLLAIAIAVVLLLTLRKPAVEVPPADVTVTSEPIDLMAQPEAEDVTATEAPQLPAATEKVLVDALAAHHDEAMTVFELLEPAQAGESSVSVYSVEGVAKAVAFDQAEAYVTKLLSMFFGDNAGFDTSFFRGDDGVWTLTMGGALSSDQVAQMLTMEDADIYARFRNMYLNGARQIISVALNVEPTIRLTVYENGKTDNDYALRILETASGNGQVQRNA